LIFDLHLLYEPYSSHFTVTAMAIPVFVTSPKEFGAEIRRRRKAGKLTQAELASATGASRRLISALENGERGVSIEMALAAAVELGLDVRLEPRT
jgi:DNA-binding XRE family transcriptional regulator